MEMTPLEKALEKCESPRQVFGVGASFFLNHLPFGSEWDLINKRFVYHDLKEEGARLQPEDVSDVLSGCGCYEDGLRGRFSIYLKQNPSIVLTEAQLKRQRKDYRLLGRGTPEERTLNCLHTWYGIRPACLGVALERVFLDPKQIRASPLFYHLFANHPEHKERALRDSYGNWGFRREIGGWLVRDAIYLRLFQMLTNPKNETYSATRFKQYIEKLKLSGARIDRNDLRTREAAVDFALARKTTKK